MGEGGMNRVIGGLSPPALPLRHHGNTRWVRSQTGRVRAAVRAAQRSRGHEEMVSTRENVPTGSFKYNHCVTHDGHAHVHGHAELCITDVRLELKFEVFELNFSNLKKFLINSTFTPNNFSNFPGGFQH